MTQKFSFEFMQHCISFMRCLHDSYGEALGQEKISKIFDVIDDDLSGEVMMFLLTEGSAYRSKIIREPGYTFERLRRISAIKSLRQAVANFTLKEAKDFIENCDHGAQTLPCHLNYDERTLLKEELKGTGYKLI